MDAKVLVLGLDGATPELLERWVEEGDDSPGRYATGLLRKLAPTSIDLTSVQPAFSPRSVWEILPVLILFRLGALAHVGGLQLFQDHRSVGVHQLPALFVQEVTALVAHLPMELSYLLGRFPTPTRPALFA